MAQSYHKPFSARPHTASQPQTLSTTLALALLVLLLALLPRALLAAPFVTVDEGYHWFDRTARFLNAITSGNWADTAIVGHPGVTTLWLGALGRATHAALAAAALIDPNDPALLRALLRLPLALVNAACVALGYLLLRRLLGGRVALLAALLWASEPFLVAHGQLLHLDALLTSFMMLSLLAALVGVGQTGDRRPETGDRRPETGDRRPETGDRRPETADGEPGDQSANVPHTRYPSRWLIVSGVFAGLALLTKSPSVLLLPLVGLLLAARSWAAGKQVPEAGGWWLAALQYGGWLLAAALTFVALWPAMWVDPLGALGSIIHQAQSDGGSPHGWGNFFLGQAVADPGPLFYPLAVALRLTPWVLLGLLALALVWRAHQRVGLTPGARLVAGWLTVFVLLFLLMMTLPAKKFDRYALPVFPPLAVLAALGLSGLQDWLRQVWRARWPGALAAGRLTPRGGWGLAGVILLLSANLAWFHPYELAYYNPLLGGAAVAPRLIPVGWGEGYEQVGAYINAQRDATDYPVASWFAPSLQPFVAAPVVPLSWALTPGKAGYAVLYLDQVQRGDEAAATALLRSQYTPIATVRVHGIEYAQIYQLPRPLATPRSATFGSTIQLRGYDLDVSLLTRERVLKLALHWYNTAAIPADYTLFIHVLDANGQRIGQADLPPGGPRDPTSRWRPGQFTSGYHQVPLWGEASPGPLWLAVGLYDPASGARLPLVATQPTGAPAAGLDALLIGPITMATTP